MRALDLRGERQGKLVAIAPAGPSAFGIMWHCQCDCGNKSIVRGSMFRRGSYKSCGCSQGHKTHNMSTSSEYCAWQSMIGRCTNHNIKSWHRYGGRGIRVCDRWMKFENFIADMGKKPVAGLTLDRIDNNGNYEPGNCRWVTPKVQARNTRRNRFVEVSGERMLLQDACDRYGISHSLVLMRVRRGWGMERAITFPATKPKVFCE